MKKIIVPKNQLQCKEIFINPNTFEPQPVIIINEDYYNEIEQKYNIKSYYMDTSYFEKWMNETGYKPDYYITDIKFEIGKFVDHSKLGMSNPALKFIDAMYNSNKGYCMPIVIEVSNKENTKYTVRDATIDLANRYIKILNPISDIDEYLDKASNKNLLWMLEQILTDESLPEDKISRWIGYIQGIMVMKGYITIDEERDYSIPLFHKVYEDNSIEIPETTETIETEDKIKIQLCYNAYDKNNYISEYRSPIFYANDANILFLNFITSIIESGRRQSYYSKNKAILYIKDNWDIFENIMKDFSKDYNIEQDFNDNVMEIFDYEILEMLIEYFQCNGYAPQEFYDYDSSNDKNPDGFLNGMGVYAYEKV